MSLRFMYVFIYNNEIKLENNEVNDKYEIQICGYLCGGRRVRDRQRI